LDTAATEIAPARKSRRFMSAPNRACGIVLSKPEP
jgi:hypothetical protein